MNCFFIFFSQIILFIKIKSDDLGILNLRGGYRIDSMFNNHALTDDNYFIQFYGETNKVGQIFLFNKTENQTYHILTKKSRKKLGVTANGHVLMAINSRDQILKATVQWNIFKIEEDQYVIQNNKTSNFLEINNNFLQCSKALPLPVNEHKSEINNVFKFKFVKIYEEVVFTPQQLEIIENEPIDVVIKYIDLSDKTLKRDGIKQIQKDEDNEEMRYSIRSILKYIPWVRKIFIVMPNEKVRYFKPYDEIKEKILYVKDKDLLGHESANIYAFTFNLFRLEKFGLSENFIYFDDDFFVGKELKKWNFFYYDENEKRVVPSLLNADFNELNKTYVLERYNSIYLSKDQLPPQCFMAWILSLYSTEKFFIEHYKDMKLINPTPSHNAISYNVKDLKEIYDLVVNNYQYANETLNSIERHVLTLQTQHFVDLYEINIKKRKVHTIPFTVIPMNLLKLNYMNTELFAINTGGDRVYTEEEYKKQRELMKLRFPNPTPYEIVGTEDENKKLKEKAIINIKNPSISKKDKEHENEKNEGNNGVMVLNNPEDSKSEQESDTQNKINLFSKVIKKQSLIIKVSNCLIILMFALIGILFYLYFNEKKKNMYSPINDFDERK